MSWLFGYFGNTFQQTTDPPEIPLYWFNDSKLTLFGGGNKQTCHVNSTSTNSCWAVVGVGLKSTDPGYKIMDDNGWNSCNNLSEPDFNSVNGHFVFLRYNNNELKIITDQLGLRDIYLVKLQSGFGFTTRVDWLKYFVEPDIDMTEFGSRWLLQNQISQKSFFKNVIRLVCANATIKNNSLFITQNLLRPEFNSTTNIDQIDCLLKKLLLINNKKIELSLSGGLDSRLLLSYLTTLDFKMWNTHTFGDSNHPDSKMADELLIKFGRNNKIIDEELPSTDKLIDLLKSYTAQTLVTNPINSILNLRYYDKITDIESVVIDGGFGEIWRRAFANRLQLLGKNALYEKNSKSVSNFLRYQRADIFTEEALDEMEKGIIRQFEELFTDMPEINTIGLDNWIDYYSVRTRLSNYYAPEQTRVDNYVVSFMPLVQKDILALIFGLKVSEKKNGKLFKQLIRRNSMQLTKIPLVKGNIVLPFKSSSLGSRLQSKIKIRLGNYYESKRRIELLNSLKEFIGDTIQSSAVRNYKYYDQKKLDKILKNFFVGNISNNYEIEWFLSFELFRQGITEIEH